MSETTDHMLREVTDLERADRIRALLRDINSEVRQARIDGLKVELSNLHTIGAPGWVGFKDAVKVTRDF